MFIRRYINRYWFYFNPSPSVLESARAITLFMQLRYDVRGLALGRFCYYDLS